MVFLSVCPWFFLGVPMCDLGVLLLVFIVWVYFLGVRPCFLSGCSLGAFLCVYCCFFFGLWSLFLLGLVSCFSAPFQLEFEPLFTYRKKKLVQNINYRVNPRIPL